MLKARLKLITDIMVEHVNNQINELEIKIRKERDKEMKLDKRLTDEVIRLTMKYFETGDIDYLPALNKVRGDLHEIGISLRNVDLIEDLAKYIQRSGKGTYDDIYRALEVFGITVEDREKVNE